MANEQITSLIIRRKNQYYWTLLGSDSVEVRSKSEYVGGNDGDYVTIQSGTGAVLYERVYFGVIKYYDENNSGNNLVTPTSATQLVTHLIAQGFFRNSVSGGGTGGVNTFKALLDVNSPGGFTGKKGYVYAVSDDEQSLIPIKVNGIIQNNIDIFKIIKTFQPVSISDPSSYVNNSSLFTVSEIESLWIDILYSRPAGINQPTNPPVTYRYKVANKGKGSYGIGGTQLVSTDFKLTYVSQTTATEIDSDPSTERVFYGNIVGQNISEWLNAQTPTIDIQSQDDGYTLFIGAIDDVESTYLFVGNNGSYGIGGLQSTLEDFQLITDEIVPIITTPAFNSFEPIRKGWIWDGTKYVFNTNQSINEIGDFFRFMIQTDNNPPVIYEARWKGGDIQDLNNFAIYRQDTVILPNEPGYEE